MSELISQTPIWVFTIFVILLLLGFIQSKERIVKIKSIFILPTAMIVFSFFGVYSAFGFTLSNISFWTAGLILPLIFGIKLSHPKLVNFSEEHNKLTIPGSWVPFILMMAIFFTKYFVAYSIARELAIVNEFMFVVTISILYGVFSGIFLSRSFVMFNARKASV